MGSCCSAEYEEPPTTIHPAPPNNYYNPQPLPVPPPPPPINPSYNPAMPMMPPYPPNYSHAYDDDPGYRWVNRCAGEPMPMGAVAGGRDVDGTLIFVGRCYHNGDMVPAKVIPDRDVAYISHSGQEIPKSNFEVLVRSDFNWVFCNGGVVPPNAVVAGQTSEGEPLYVGRTMHNGSQTIGKVHQSHGCLYIPFGGQELSFRDYEVLIYE